MTERDLEAELRAGLAAHARQAPSGELLAERIIDDARTARPTRDFHRPGTRRWRTWALPVVAAGSVAAIVAALAGVTHSDHRAAPDRPGVSTTLGPAPATRAVGPVDPKSSAPGSPAGNPSSLRHFRVLDLSFTGTNDGWALGTAACIKTPNQTCTALAHTIDGVQWTGLTGNDVTPFNVAGVGDCAAPCVQHIRFADDEVGYAYGPSAFFMTTNGGRSWTHEPGGADALETLDHNVIRVSDPCGCSPGATYAVQLSAVGSAQWAGVGLPGAPVTGVAVQLQRTGRAAYLLVTQNPAGGASSAVSSLFSSADDGHSWLAHGEVCPQTATGPAGSEVDSTQLAAASDGSVTVVCTPRGTPDASFLATSVGGRAAFHPSAGTLPAGADAPIASTTGSVVLVGADNAGGPLWRTTDGGASWRRPSDSAAPTGELSSIGFESASVGRAVSNNGATVWTTRDAGATWTAATFTS